MLPTADDDDDDCERYGGPITPGNLMTLLRACRTEEYDTLIPQSAFDMAKLAREINSWLVLVGDTAVAVAGVTHITKQ
jgi:hypothetical protein